MSQLCLIMNGECTQEGRVHSRSLCRKHYERMQRNGSVVPKTNVRPRKAGPGENWCSKCSQFLPVALFSKSKHRSNGLVSVCKDCASDVNKEAYDSERTWARKIRSRYGMSVGEYNELHDRQDGKCAICKQSGMERLHVDHCHETGAIRGLLCWRCNTTLGKVEDSVELLASMINYLDEAAR